MHAKADRKETAVCTVCEILYACTYARMNVCMQSDYDVDDCFCAGTDCTDCTDCRYEELSVQSRISFFLTPQQLPGGSHCIVRLQILRCTSYIPTILSILFLLLASPSHRLSSALPTFSLTVCSPESVRLFTGPSSALVTRHQHPPIQSSPCTGNSKAPAIPTHPHSHPHPYPYPSHPTHPSHHIHCTAASRAF